MSSLQRLENIHQDSIYNPESMSIVSEGSSRKNKKQGTKLSQGQWTEEQCIKYVIFMQINQQIFNSKTKRKNVQIFKKLSQFLGTRTARQCRSHFQKLKNRFGTIVRMRNFWKKEIGSANYEQYLSKFSQIIKHSEINLEDTEKETYNKTVDIGIQTDEVICVSPHYFQMLYHSTFSLPQCQMGMKWLPLSYNFVQNNDNLLGVPNFN